MSLQSMPERTRNKIGDTLADASPPLEAEAHSHTVWRLDFLEYGTKLK